MFSSWMAFDSVDKSIYILYIYILLLSRIFFRFFVIDYVLGTLHETWNVNDSGVLRRGVL